MKNETPAPAANSDILNKVEALLNKAGNPATSEAEAKLYFAKAAELMTKHGIEQHQLGQTKDDGADKVEEVGINKAWRTERPTHLYVRLVIKHCFHVTVLRYRVPGLVVRYSLVGTKEDCAFAAYAWDVLNDTFLRLWNKYAADYSQPRIPSVWNSYLAGLQAGFCRAWDDAQRAEMKVQHAESFALVLVDKDKAIAVYCEEA